MFKNSDKKQATLNYIKHNIGQCAGAAGAGVGVGFVKVASEKILTTNPVANIAIAAGGSVAAVAGIGFAFDQTIKSYADIKELVEIEETARRLSNLK